MKLRITIVFLFLGIAAVQAQLRWPDGYTYKKLDNGLEVVTIVNRQLPMVNVELALKNGAITEGPEFTGLSHLYEHLSFHANKNFPTNEAFYAFQEENGIFPGGQTRHELVRYVSSAFNDKLDELLHYANSAVRDPIFTQKGIETEREVVASEIRAGENDPYSVLYDEVSKKLWKEMYSRKNPGGELDVILTATPEKMHLIRSKYYYPNNAILVITGDIDPKDAMRKAEKHFSDWKPSDFDPFAKYPVPDFQPLDQSTYFVHLNPLARSPYLLYMWQGPGYATDSTGLVAMQLAAAMLRQKGSGFSKALQENTNTSQFGMYISFTKFPSTISLELAPIPDKLPEATGTVQDQLLQMAAPGYFTEKQLELAKNSLIKSSKRQSERPITYSYTLTNYWASASLDYYVNNEQIVRKITLDDVEKAVKKYLVGKPFVAGLTMNEELNSRIKPETFFNENNEL